MAPARVDLLAPLLQMDCIDCDPAQLEQLRPSAWPRAQLQVWTRASPNGDVGDWADAQFARSGVLRVIGFAFTNSRFANCSRVTGLAQPPHVAAKISNNRLAVPERPCRAIARLLIEPGADAVKIQTDAADSLILNGSSNLDAVLPNRGADQSKRKKFVGSTCSIVSPELL
jgi:hypothetical protein